MGTQTKWSISEVRIGLSSFPSSASQHWPQSPHREVVSDAFLSSSLSGTSASQWAGGQGKDGIVVISSSTDRSKNEIVVVVAKVAAKAGTNDKRSRRGCRGGLLWLL